jgi:hypothetical protein
MQTMWPRVTDYWDSTTGAIDVLAKELASLSTPKERESALTELAAAVREHVRVLPDKVLITAAVAAADDLYKGACWIDRWDSDLAAFLQATAAVFWSSVSERGFTLHYLVDNTFDDLERPVKLFPGWFRSAGVIFVCPQVVAVELIRAVEGAEAPPRERLASYTAEARDVVESILDRCRAESRHFFLLDLDAEERSHRTSLAVKDQQGVLTIVRSEGAQPGTSVTALVPRELRA